MMKNKKVDQIKECLKKGIPIATLGVAAISTTVMMSGCDDLLIDVLYPESRRTPGILPRECIKSSPIIISDEYFTTANELTEDAKKELDILMKSIKNNKGRWKFDHVSFPEKFEGLDEKSKNILKQRLENIKKYFAENGIDLKKYEQISSNQKVYTTGIVDSKITKMCMTLHWTVNNKFKK
jgi:hypothetical protein